MKSKFLLFLSILLILFPLFTACGGERVVFENGLYRDTETKVNYRVAPVSFEPVAIGSEYASCEDYSLFSIENADPLLFLCDDTGAVYVSESVEIPSLAEFGADALYLGNLSDSFHAIAEVTDPETVSAIVKVFETGEKTAYPAVFDSSYVLEFTSSDYPFLCYSVVFVSANGVNMLFDRSTGICVDAGDLLESILDPNAA